ncbi:hypothetical protein Q3G72_028111 [Acer saccharum]|nr:hypothetical protein Q3G72_028111 [Acer saccharum]
MLRAKGCMLLSGGSEKPALQKNQLDAKILKPANVRFWVLVAVMMSRSGGDDDDFGGGGGGLICVDAG